MAGLFDSIVQATLVHEGSGLNTRGGEYSKFGINKKHNKDVDIENLTADKAKEIYRKKYWEKPRINDLLDESTNIAAKVFDTGVNQGQGRSIKMLQSVLRELGQDIKVDGIIGPKTEKALENALSNYSEGDILNRLSSLQLARYQSLPSYEANKGGWDNRAAWTPDFPKAGYTGFAMEGFGGPQILGGSTPLSVESIYNKHLPQRPNPQQQYEAARMNRPPLTPPQMQPPQQMPTLQQQAATAQVQPALNPFPWLKEVSGSYSHPVDKSGMYPPKKMFKSRSMYPLPKK